MTPTRLRFGDVALAAVLALLALALFSLDWRNGLYGGIAEVGAQFARYLDHNVVS